MAKDNKNNKRVLPPDNPSFCIAPWTHTYISPQSERRMCCASRETHSFVHQYIDQAGEKGTTQYKPETLDEHWNNEHMRSVRRRMMAGERLPECEVCSDQVLNIYTYKSYFNKTLFPQYIEKAFATTDDDGRTTMQPISFDYRLKNTCNFKCRMCGELLSSSWEIEKRQFNEWDPKKDPWMVPQINNQIKKFQKEVVEKEFAQAISEGRVEEIYWVGGEPLMWEEHWKYMKQLVDEKQAHKVFVRYNTNLSKISHRGVHLFDDLLPHFKDYNVCASIDAPGKIGEYIRTGLVWEEWLENFKAGVKHKGNRTDSIVMDVTLTLPGLFGMKELLKYALELDVKFYVKIVFAFDPSIVLSPFAAPKSVLHNILDDLIKDCEPLVNDKTRVLVETFKEMKSRPTFDEIYPNFREGFINGRANLQALAARRGDGKEGRLTIENIYESHPELLKWWTQK